MKPVMFAAILVLALVPPSDVSAAPRYPCGEMHRTADAGGPLCRTTGPFRGAQRVDPPGRDSLGVASPTVR